MKGSIIATTLALCSLTSPTIASPLEERAIKTVTVTESINHTKYKTKTVTEEIDHTKTKTINHTKTKTVTIEAKAKTSTIVKPTTIVSTLVRPTTLTLSSTKVVTSQVIAKASTVTQQVTGHVSTVTIPSTQFITITSVASATPSTITLMNSLQGQTITSWLTSACTSDTASAAWRTISATNGTGSVGTTPTVAAASSSSSTIPATSSPSSSAAPVILSTGYIQAVQDDVTSVYGQCGFIASNSTEFDHPLAFTGTSNDTTAPQEFALMSDGTLVTGDLVLGANEYYPNPEEYIPYVFISGLTTAQLSDPNSYYKPLNCSVENSVTSCAIGPYYHNSLQTDRAGLISMLWADNNNWESAVLQFVDLGDCSNAMK